MDGDLVGIVKLCLADGGGRLGYILRADRWGRGHASGAAVQLLDFAFASLRVPLVRARHRVGNEASGRVLVKAGFRSTGSADGFVRYVVRSPGGLEQ